MSHKANRQLALILSLPTLFVLVVLGFVPLSWPIFSRYEGWVLPVVENVEISEHHRTRDGLVINVRFDKVRSCEFLGVSWYDTFGSRVPIHFDLNEEDSLPESRPVMDEQDAGPWHLSGISHLEGSVAVVSHRCHPFWITYSRFYP